MHLEVVESPQKLLYIAHFDPGEVASGTSARGRTMLQALQPHFDITLVCFSREKGRPASDESIWKRVRRIATPYSKLGYYGISLRLLREAEGAIRDSRPDLILADADKTGLYAWWLGRKYGIPFVYSSHNVEFERFLELARTSPLRLLLVPWMWMVECLALHRAAASIAISERDARRFRKLVPGARIEALPMAYDERLFHASRVACVGPRPVILMVANYGYSPNLVAARALMKHVIPQVVRERPDVVFRFVGRGLPADFTHPNVQIAGLVEDLAAEYREASVVVNPVKAGGGIKIKSVEALACGKCLVSTPDGMKGIDLKEIELVSIGPVEQFPSMILRALSEGKYDTTANQAMVQSAFGAQNQTQRLLGILRGAVRQARISAKPASGA